ncbi:MAG TPA: twin-arginine translocase subunit TatC [Candidatus Limnocylindria bacterium]
MRCTACCAAAAITRACGSASPTSSAARITRRRGYILIICFVIGAIITPTPDPFNQTLVSVPMYLLFELGLLLSRFGGGRRRAT